MTLRHVGLVAFVLSGTLYAAGACKPGALPGWDDGTAAPEEGAAAEGSLAAADPEVESDTPVTDEVEEASEDVTGEATQGASKEGTGTDTDGPSAKSEKKPRKPAALPKPLYTKADPSCGKGPGIGSPLASFSLPSPDGKTISPAKYRGRVLLVNFWGTWCKPCLEELPTFDRLYRRYRKHGLTLVAVATDEDPEAVREFVARKKLAAKVAYKGEAAANRYGSDRFPFSFVVDPRGVIVASYRGFEPRCLGQLEADIRKALEARNGT